MKCLIVIVVIVSLAAARERTYPASILEGVQDSGYPNLQTKYNQAIQSYNAAIEALEISNATCIEKYDLAVNSCISCINEKCLARVEEVCQTEDTSQIQGEIQRPQEWQIVLGKTIGFATQDVPNFFTNTIPDVFVNKVGGEIVDAANDVGNFLDNTVGDGAIDIGNAISGGVINGANEAIDFGAGVGKDIINGVVDATNVIDNVASKGVNAIVDGVNTAVDEIEDFGNDAVKTIGRFLGIGKRSVRMRRQAQAEPGCPEFQSNATVACQFYLNPTYCSSCAFSKATDCPQYAADLSHAQDVSAAVAWIAKMTDGKYTITEMKYDTLNYDPETGGFTDVAVSATVFGADVSFTVMEAIDPFDPEVSGPTVALKALEAFKNA